MSDLRWILIDEAGTELRATERFETKDEAEAWMGANWSALLEEGGHTVRLMDGDDSLYEMGLTAG